MKQFDLKATARKDFSKSAVKAIRRNGFVPCVMYGKNQENLHFTVEEKELRNFLYTPYSFIVVLDLDGVKHFCILYDVQYHPVTDRPLHMDFLAVDEVNPITINVPIVITGNSEGVRAGGKLQVTARKLKIKALMKDLPDDLTIDITPLKIGKSITAGDLHFDNIEIVSPSFTNICTVKSTRGAVESATSEEAAAE